MISVTREDHAFDNVAPLIQLAGAEEVKKSPRARVSYINLPVSFDIETTSTRNEDGDKLAFMYVWSLAIDGIPYVGRTWEQFIDLLGSLINVFNTSPRRRLVIYVHNLAHEFAFMRFLLSYCEALAVKDRVPLYATQSEGIEFRCSYRLSGYSLDNLQIDKKWKIRKLKGYDYSKIRHHETPLTPFEIQYVINDSLKLNCYIQDLFNAGYNLATIPLTATGFARQQMKEAIFNGPDPKKFAKIMAPLKINDAEEYQLFLDAYQGGDAHASARYVGKLLKFVHSFDIGSDYPSIMVMEKFPMTAPLVVRDLDAKKISNLRNIKDGLFVGRFTFTNFREKPGAVHHPLSASKCGFAGHKQVPIRNGIGTHKEDNGRVVSSRYPVTVALSNVDLDTLEMFYDWDDITASYLVAFVANYLPSEIVGTILDTYHRKTKLKGVPGKELEYEHVKGALFNSYYGMMGTKPIREADLLDPGSGLWKTEREDSEPVDIDTELLKIAKKRDRFLYPWWAVFITSYARHRLARAIFALGSNFVYCDTDSTKFRRYAGAAVIFDAFNDETAEKMRAAMAYHGFDPDRWIAYTIKDKKKPLGFWEDEGYYQKFKTLGAKRYMTKQRGKYKITVAGLSKKMGSKYLAKASKNDALVFDQFCDKMEIPPEYSGRITHSYIDSPFEAEITDYLGNVATVKECSACHLEPAGYSMSLSDVFADYLAGLAIEERMD